METDGRLDDEDSFSGESNSRLQAIGELFMGLDRSTPPDFSPGILNVVGEMIFDFAKKKKS